MVLYQYFGGFFIRAFLLFILLFALEVLAGGKKYKDIEIKAESGSVESLVRSVYYNVDWEGRKPRGKVRYKKNLESVELDMIKRHIAKGNPQDNSIFVVRYGGSHEKFINLLIEAKKKGLKSVVWVTDFNRAVTIDHRKWPVDKKTGKRVPFMEATKAVDKGWARYKTGAMDSAIQKLKENGFKINSFSASDPYTIITAPIYYTKPGVMVDIMHLKQLYLLTPKTIQMTEATTNLSEGADRINSVTVFKPEKLIRNPDFEYISNNPLYKNLNFTSYNFWHAVETVQTLKKGLRYKDIIEPIEGVKKSFFNIRSSSFVFPDGSSVQSAYTLGRYNSNDRITVDILQNMDQISEIFTMGFLETNTDYARAVITMLMNNPDAKITGAVDIKFVDQHGFSMTPLLIGKSVARRNLSNIYRIPDVNIPHDYIKNFDRIEQKVFMDLYSKPHRGLNLYPYAERLLHTKTTMIKFKDGSVRIYDGSFNRSAHKENTESQSRFQLPEESKLVKEREIALRGIVQKLSKNMMSIETALFLKTICYTVGLGFDHITIDVAEDLYKTVKRGHLNKFVEKLETYRNKLREHMHSLERINKEIFDLRMEALKKAISEYKNIPKKYQMRPEVWIPKFLYAMSNPYVDTLSVKSLLTQMFYQISINGDLGAVERKIINNDLSKKFWDLILPSLIERENFFNELNRSHEKRRRLLQVAGYQKYVSPYRQGQLTIDGIPKFPRTYITNDIEENVYRGDFSKEKCIKLFRVTMPGPGVDDLTMPFALD